MSVNLNYEVLLFTAPNCGPCRQLKPNMLKLQDQYEFKMRVFEMSPETKSEFDARGIRAAPTVIGIDEAGNQLGIFVGAQAPPILERHLRKWGII